MPEKNKHFEKAEKHLQKGKLDSALDELLEARAEEPSNDSIVLTLAETYHLLNRPADRRQCIVFLFDKYVERSDEIRAIEMFSRLSKLGPVEPKRLLQAGRLLERQKPDDAKQCYEKAIAISGDHSPEMTLDCLDGLVRLQPNSQFELQRVAEYATKLGKNDRAAAAYKKLADLLSAEKSFAEAVDFLEAALRVKPASADLRTALANACTSARQFGRVIGVVEENPDLAGDPQALSLLAQAYLAEGQRSKAEAAYWKLVKTDPEAWKRLVDIAVDLMKSGDFANAMPLLERIGGELPEPERNNLIQLASRMSEMRIASVPALEFMARVAERIHLDTPLAAAMQQLFDLYLAGSEFQKAAEALERLIDVNPYGADCSVKLRQLEGKADPAYWNELASRLGQTATGSTQRAAVVAPKPEVKKQAAQGAGNMLGDLILQAEIFLQYNLTDKARERMERIARQFPGEETHNEEVKALFDRIGFVPHFAPARDRPATVRPIDKQADWGVISEVIRNLTRQGSVKGVLSSAVNDIGRLWQASRCVVGLATLNQPPTAALEYIAQGAKPSDAPLLGKLIMHLQKITEAQGSSLVAEKVEDVRQLQPLKALLGALRIDSLVAIPLREDDQAAGILILEQCGSERRWEQNDIAALQTIADQVVMAIANARLRSLMKTLAVTDERSGLLNRESYISCLLSEADRMKSQKVPLAAAIMDFSEPASGERRAVLEEFIKQFQGAFTGQLRQNDIPLQYGPFSLAVIMPATSTSQASLVVDKMRKLSANVYSAVGQTGNPPMAVGVAEAVLDEEMDSADIVTELINRVETAVEEARTTGANVTRVAEAPSVQQ